MERTSFDLSSLNNEVEGIALLRQIFPDEPTEALRQLHRRRTNTVSTRIYRDEQGLGLTLCRENEQIVVDAVYGEAARRAGIQVGDVLVGVGGQSIEPRSLLREVVQFIRSSEDPVVLLWQRRPRYKTVTPSLFDTTLQDEDTLDQSFQPVSSPSTPLETKHAIVEHLLKKGLIQSRDANASRRALSQYHTRAHHLETATSLQWDKHTWIPLVGLRPALCLRILHTFEQDGQPHYAIGVYDVAAGREWHAPVRSRADVRDLQQAVQSLHPSLGGGSRSWFRNETVEHPEVFLRRLASLIYKEDLHPGMAEIAVHLQTFLGCDAWPDRPPQSTRLELKRSLQLFTYRILLLLEDNIETFVETVRMGDPNLHELEELEAKGRDHLKERAVKQLQQVHTFLEFMQDLILEGCREDFRSVALQEEYTDLHDHVRGDSVFWNRLVREAVREQLEIEIYVPLRSIVSRWLVRGWKYEDMEVCSKMKALRTRPPSFFRVPDSLVDSSEWKEVTVAFREGVGKHTLPCNKLSAIVEAASALARLHDKVRSQSGDDHFGADAFLPIFIYCVAQSEIERPFALCVLLKNLCDRINKIGEVGYYLASYEAAVTHIQEIDLCDDAREISFMSVPLDRM